MVEYQTFNLAAQYITVKQSWQQAAAYQMAKGFVRP